MRSRLRIPRHCAAIYALPLAIACSGPGGPGEEGQATSQTSTLLTPPGAASVQRRTVQLGVETSLWVQTVPNATCVLHDPSGADPAQQLEVFSDDRGVIPFTARTSVANAKQEVALDCYAADGSSASHTVEITAVSGAQAAASNPPMPHVASITRPALAEDPATITDEELHKRGYPPRPDRAKAPALYDSWLSMVTRPGKRITAPAMAHPNRFHGPAGHPAGMKPRPSTGAGDSAMAAGARYNETSSVWSGRVANDWKVYDFVYGQWNVPTITGDGTNCAQSFWPGLDGWYDGSVVQSGTAHYVAHIWFFDFAYYYSWVEYYPASEVQIGVAVSPGDLVVAYVWATDAAGNTNATGGYGTFLFYNLTKSTYWEGTIQAPSGGAIPADPAYSSAEWIMENPNYGAAHFSNYGTAQMLGFASASDGTSQWNWDPPAFLVDLYNPPTGHLLSSAFMQNYSYLTFQWYAYW